MKYICELCGKKHNTLDDATNCETSCKAKKEKEKVLLERRKQRLDNIKESIVEYNADYGTNYNIINVTPSNLFDVFSLI